MVAQLTDHSTFRLHLNIRIPRELCIWIPTVVFFLFQASRINNLSDLISNKEYYFCTGLDLIIKGLSSHHSANVRQTGKTSNSMLNLKFEYSSKIWLLKRQPLFTLSVSNCRSCRYLGEFLSIYTLILK